MPMTLVQSVLGGNGSGSFTAGGGGATSCIGHFGSNTTTGNLLILVAFHNQTRTSGSGFAPANLSVTGGAWSAAVDFGGFDSGARRSSCALFITGNAASVSSGTTMTVTITDSSSSANGTESIEFQMYEFSGLAASNSTTTGGALIDTKNQLSNQSSTVPNFGTITTVATDLVVGYFIGSSGNGTAGAGYTLGQSNVAATTGQLQYQLNVPAGSVATSFTGSQTNWGGGAISFKAGVSSAKTTTYVSTFGF